MSIPTELTPLLRKRDFWRRFFWELEDGHAYSQLEGCEIALPLDEGASLALKLDEYLAYFSLNLRHPSLADEVEIAWDDQAHWHPHVLRWEELDLIGRWVALSDLTLPHPGLVVLLLHRFTPLCAGDEAVAHPLLEGAYRSLGIFRGKGLEERLHRSDYRDAGFIWRQDPDHGWVLTQDATAPDADWWELYTLRHPESRIFPFGPWNSAMAEVRDRYQRAADPTWLDRNGGRGGELARDMAANGKLTRRPELLEALEQAGCRNASILAGVREGASPVTSYWVLELLLGEPPGALIRKHCGRKKRPVRVTHRFQIQLPGFPVRLVEPTDPLCRELIADLDRQLRHGVSGGARRGGDCSVRSPDGRTLLEEAKGIECEAVNDDETAIRIIRAVLLKHGVPDGTTLRQTTREQREIPLSQGE